MTALSWEAARVRDQVESLCRITLGSLGVDPRGTEACWRDLAEHFPWHIGTAAAVSCSGQWRRNKADPFVRAVGKALADCFTEALKHAITLEAELWRAGRRPLDET